MLSDFFDRGAFIVRVEYIIWLTLDDTHLYVNELLVIEATLDLKVRGRVRTEVA